MGDVSGKEENTEQEHRSVQTRLGAPKTAGTRHVYHKYEKLSLPKTQQHDNCKASRHDHRWPYFCSSHVAAYFAVKRSKFFTFRIIVPLLTLPMLMKQECL